MNATISYHTPQSDSNQLALVFQIITFRGREYGVEYFNAKFYLVSLIGSDLPAKQVARTKPAIKAAIIAFHEELEPDPEPAAIAVVQQARVAATQEKPVEHVIPVPPYRTGDNVEVCLNSNVSVGEWKSGTVLEIRGQEIKVRYPAPYPDCEDYESWFALKLVRKIKPPTNDRGNYYPATTSVEAAYADYERRYGVKPNAHQIVAGRLWVGVREGKAA